MKKLLISALLFLGLALPAFGQITCTADNRLHHDAGVYTAASYDTWKSTVFTGSATGGTYSIVLVENGVTLCDGAVIQPFSVTAPITIGSGTNAETVTPTGVSGCVVRGPIQTCTVTAVFANPHARGDIVISGTAGLQEAINAAFGSSAGGGKVVVDNAWIDAGGTDTILNAAIPYSSVAIIDNRKGATQYWNSAPSTTTAVPTPTALASQAACDSTHQFCSDSTVAGSASWGGTVHGCITLVDINGNESACSPDASFTSVASKAIDIGPPAARTDNVVGWKPYLSVSGGSYALAYSLPLLTQPSTLLVAPVSSGVCTLTTLETTTPACALTNSTYGQTASTVGAGTLFKGGAQFTSYPVVTNTLAPEIGSASATAYNPNEAAYATYAYIPGLREGIPGIQSSWTAFPITAAAQTTVGQVEATIPLPANFMNFVGRKIEVCGLIAKTGTTADTVDKIQVWWDAEGSNVTAGTPVQISSINITEATALAAAANFQFCQQMTTTVASTSATGGTIQPGQGYATVSQVSAGANPSSGSSSLVAGVGSLNLALPAHLTVMLVHTTGTDGAGSILYGASVRIIN